MHITYEGINNNDFQISLPSLSLSRSAFTSAAGIETF